MKLTIEASATELQKMLRAIAGSEDHEKFRVNIDGDGIHFSDSEGELKASADGSFIRYPQSDTNGNKGHSSISKEAV